MYAQIGTSSIYLAVLITFVVFFLHWKKRNSSEGMQDIILYLNVVVMILLWLSFILLSYGFVSQDYSLKIVYGHIDNSMNFMERLMATWASRPGVMILWSTIMATITTTSLFYLKDELDNEIVQKVFTIVLFFNALIASFILSVRDPTPFEMFDANVIIQNGVGLVPSLMSFWMQIHPPIAFLAYSSFILPYAYGLGILSYNKDGGDKVPRKLHWLNDFYILLGWLMTTLFIIAGSIWGYEENWAGFWNWDPVEVASLVLWASATLYFHVKSQVSDNHVLRYFAAALGWIAVAFASFIVRSGILSGVHSYAGSAQMYVFGTLLLGSILGLLYALSQTDNELFPDYLYDYKKHRNKPKFFTFWAITGLIILNTVGLIMQIINALSMGVSDIPYAYYIYGNGILLFALGMLLVFCEIDYTYFSKQQTAIGFAILTIFGGLFSYLTYIRTPMTLVFISLLMGALVLLIVNLVMAVKRDKNYRKIRMNITHILVIFMIISYIGVDYNTSRVEVSVFEDEMKTIEEFGITINTSRWTEGANYYIGVTVWENGEILGTVTLSHGIHQDQYWTRGGWIVKPLNDYFIHSLESNIGIISEDDPMSIAIKKVPMANYFRILFIMFSISTPFALYSILKRKK